MEIFAFAGAALDPVFAVEVFAAGAGGLGAMLASRAAGRLVGSLTVIAAHTRHPFGRLLPASVLLFGASLIGLAAAPSLGPGVVFVFGAGIAGALVDSLEQAGLAAAAPDEERGRAEGLWVVAIGIGQIGVAEISIVAAILGARAAQLSSGLIVAAFGLALLLRLHGKELGALDPRGFDPAAAPAYRAHSD
jgi:MFS family permease